jgi:hypothetical protein
MEAINLSYLSKKVGNLRQPGATIDNETLWLSVGIQGSDETAFFVSSTCVNYITFAGLFTSQKMTFFVIFKPQIKYGYIVIKTR